MRIDVVGSANIDLVAGLERLPEAGETLASTSFAMVPGGKGANQAVAAARLGAEVRFVGAVGEDAHGDALVAALAADGIDTSATLPPRACVRAGVHLRRSRRATR